MGGNGVSLDIYSPLLNEATEVSTDGHATVRMSSGNNPGVVFDKLRAN